MKTATRHQQPAGRFGREVRDDDGTMDKARTTMQADHAEQRFETAGYEIDADAVAAAIITRLLAGGALSRRSPI